VNVAGEVEWGEVKGKLVNAVGSQYPSHYIGTWCIESSEVKSYLMWREAKCNKVK